MQIRCPQCGEEIKKDEKQSSICFPFCSRKCKLVDLGGWFDNKYKIISPLNNEEDKKNDRDDG